MMKFYICEVCGNLVGMIDESGVPMQCCDQDMTELIPGTSNGAPEKHVPVCKTEGHTVVVTVGSVNHPMESSHYIEWIAIKTAKGVQRKILAPGNSPCAKFALTEDDTLVATYAYCNLHGLWMHEGC